MREDWTERKPFKTVQLRLDSTTCLWGVCKAGGTQKAFPFPCWAQQDLTLSSTEILPSHSHILCAKQVPLKASFNSQYLSFFNRSPWNRRMWIFDNQPKASSMKTPNQKLDLKYNSFQAVEWYPSYCCLWQYIKINVFSTANNWKTQKSLQCLFKLDEPSLWTLLLHLCPFRTGKVTRQLFKSLYIITSNIPLGSRSVSSIFLPQHNNIQSPYLHISISPLFIKSRTCRALISSQKTGTLLAKIFPQDCRNHIDKAAGCTNKWANYHFCFSSQPNLALLSFFINCKIGKDVVLLK